jgi:hypothetical protein
MAWKKTIGIFHGVENFFHSVEVPDFFLEEPRRAASRCGREVFFQDRLEKVGGVGPGLLDLPFQLTAGRHQPIHPLHDRGCQGQPLRIDKVAAAGHFVNS